MTQEEKELLLKDLCARLPYGVMMKGVNEDFELSTKTSPKRLSYVLNSTDFKPYLRPMSSMSDEEYAVIYDMCWPKDLEFKETCGSYWRDFKTKKDIPYFMYNSNQIDYLTSHHFDYRGLISKGIALAAPEEMYKN